MLFRTSNHPSKTFPSNQDESLRRNSSLQDISIKSGCISPLEFIPARHFHQIRMNSPAGIHPSMTFPSNQDECRCRKACCPQKASWQPCAPQAHISASAKKTLSQLPPISPGLSFHQKAPASVSARKLRIHLCLDGKHNSRELPDAVIVHAADGNRYGKCVPRPAIQ